MLSLGSWGRSALARLVEIHPGEGRRVALMYALALFVGAAKSFSTTASVAIFFARFDASVLPYTYIGSAVAVSAAGYAYSALEYRLGFARLLPATLVCVAAFFLMLRVAMLLTTAAWPAFVIGISNEIVGVLVGLVYWALAARLFNVRQGKRLFGFIGSGTVIALAAAGFGTPLLVTLTSSAELVTATAVSMLLATVLLIYILRAYRHSLLDPEEEASADSVEPRPGVRRRVSRWRDSYLWALIAYGSLAQMVYYAIDSGFVTESDAQYPDTAQLAGFLGVFSSITYLITFAVGAALVGPLMVRYGVRVQALLSPISIGVGVVAVVLAGTASAPAIVVFGLLCVSKLLIEINWESVYSSVKPVLFQPVPARNRLWAQTMVEGVAEPIAQGVFGVLLIGYAVFVPLTGLTLSGASLPLCVAFTLVGVVVGRGYVRRLGDVVAKRTLQRGTLTFGDPALREALRLRLASTDAFEVIYCLNRIEELGDERLPLLLGALVSHVSPDVRAEAARRIERRRFQDAFGTVMAQLVRETDPVVRAALIRASLALEPSQAIHRMAPYANSPDKPVRVAALAALLSYAIGTTLASALERLRALTDSERLEDRLEAAEIARDIGITAAMHVMPRLLRDPDSAVRRAALLAAPNVNSSSLWPPILANLDSPATRLHALAAIVEAGVRIVPVLDRALAAEDLPLQKRELLLRACGRIGGDNAVAILWRHLRFPHVEVRTEALRALALCGYTATNQRRTEITELLEVEAAVAYLSLAAQAVLEPANIMVPEILDALKEDYTAALERVFLTAGLRYERGALASAQAKASDDSPETRAIAVEVLDSLLAQEHKALILPLVEDLDAGDRLARLRKELPTVAVPESDHTPATVLALLVSQPPSTLSSWTRMCARNVLETTLSTAPANAGANHMVDQKRDLDGKSAGSIASIEQIERARGAMLTSFERVLLLKRVPLFRRTPDAGLVDVAEAMDEVELPAGDVFMREGQIGEALYVVVDGTVSLSQDGREVSVLARGDVGGELEALDPQPRAATATATSDCRLLVLHRDLLFELMGERLEVAHGVVEFLIRRYARPSSAVALAPNASAPPEPAPVPTSEPAPTPAAPPAPVA